MPFGWGANPNFKHCMTVMFIGMTRHQCLSAGGLIQTYLAGRHPHQDSPLVTNAFRLGG